MSLRDEVEKLIQAEQSKLEVRDGKQAEYHETQRARFCTHQADIGKDN